MAILRYLLADDAPRRACMRSASSAPATKAKGVEKRIAVGFRDEAQGLSR